MSATAFFILVAAYLVYKIFWYVLLVRYLRPEMAKLAVPAVHRPIDEPAIQNELNKVAAAASPPWVKEAVDDWLATAQGDEKNRKRAGLLERLYSYAADSTVNLATRSAVNQLRLAINPWVDHV